MPEQLTVPNPFPVSQNTYRFICPDCRQPVTVTRHGWTTCGCGRRWELQIVAVAGPRPEPVEGQAHQVGPSEVK